MSIDRSAAALSDALRIFGESLGRALAEGISRGVQEGLSQSLDLDQLANQVPRRAAQAGSLAAAPVPRRGGRPRGQARPCRIPGCPDPARSRGLCSRHYQQELRREKNAAAAAAAAKAKAEPEQPPAPVEAKPPMVRKRAEAEQQAPSSQLSAETPPPQEAGAAPESAARVIQEHLRRSSDESARPSTVDAAKRIFG